MTYSPGGSAKNVATSRDTECCVTSSGRCNVQPKVHLIVGNWDIRGVHNNYFTEGGVYYIQGK